MQIFYINLDRRTDRREFMERQMDVLGLNAERLSAATPDTLSPDALRYCDRRRDNWVTPVELACSYSHRRAWQIIVDRNLPGAVLFEDDVVLASSLPAALPNIARALVGLDLIKIEASVAPLLIDPPEAGWLRRVYSYSYGAAGYAISNRGAEILLRHAVPDIPVDDLLFSRTSPMAHRMAVRQTVPAFCITLDRLPSVSGGATEAMSDLGQSASDRMADLYRSRHVVGPRMLRYGRSRIRNDIRLMIERTVGPARNARLATIPLDGE